jgi:hypothetical protein
MFLLCGFVVVQDSFALLRRPFYTVRVTQQSADETTAPLCEITAPSNFAFSQYDGAKQQTSPRAISQ